MKNKIKKGLCVKIFISLATLVCLTAVVVNISEARRVQEPVHQFFEGEPTKQLTIGIDFIGTIALGSEGQAREGMLDFLRELKTRGHKVFYLQAHLMKSAYKKSLS